MYHLNRQCTGSDRASPPIGAALVTRHPARSVLTLQSFVPGHIREHSSVSCWFPSPTFASDTKSSSRILRSGLRDRVAPRGRSPNASESGQFSEAGGPGAGFSRKGRKNGYAPETLEYVRKIRSNQEKVEGI